MTKLELLVTLQGKTLKWSGFDKQSDGYILLFDDGTALNVSEFEQIDDFPIFAGAMLNEEITEAKQIVALQGILNPAKPEDEAVDQGEGPEDGQ